MSQLMGAISSSASDRGGITGFRASILRFANPIPRAQGGRDDHPSSENGVVGPAPGWGQNEICARVRGAAHADRPFFHFRKFREVIAMLINSTCRNTMKWVAAAALNEARAKTTGPTP
jgi:hypothetical protein